MKYSTFVPHFHLQPLVECYWIAEGNTAGWQKIVPDGFPEIILHFGDAYEISADQIKVERQSRTLVAGQLSQPVFLRPTGRSGVLGIKFKPTGIWRMFYCRMDELMDQALASGDVLRNNLEALSAKIGAARDDKTRIEEVENFLLHQLKKTKPATIVDAVLNDVRTQRGQLSMKDLASRHNITPRKLERDFQEQVGMTAKMYSRLNRFTHVFGLLQQPVMSKVEAVYLSGYFDQAHFNKEFRGFAGENPEAYFRQNHSFSNFFLNR
jgi:AraC-like DNA-binding protein